MGESRYNALNFNVDIPAAHLHRRLCHRTREMIEAGWAEEVRNLIDRYGPEIRPLGSVGYRQMKAHVVEGEPIESTEQQIVRATRLYAKRQRTWFKGDPDFKEAMTPERVLGDEGAALVKEHLAT
jgi:tRNA dimethylallyltransferase